MLGRGGEARGGAARVRAAAAPVGGAPRRGAVCRAALAPSRAPRCVVRWCDYYATRELRVLVLWCFMMVRHESARYADVP